MTLGQGLLAWRWHASTELREPQAAVGHGGVAQRLLQRLGSLPSGRRERLSATAAPGWLVVLGPSDALPWVDGVRYAAPHPQAPALWLPTHAEPEVSIDLVWQALQQRHGRTPLLLWPAPAAVLPLDRPLLVSDDLLAAVTGAWGAGA